MAKDAIQAGALDKRLELFRPDYGPGGFEDEIVGWISVGKVWAALEPAKADEVDEANRKVGVVDLKIVVRFRRDIDFRWRLTHQTATFEVVGIINPLKRNERLELNVKEVL